MDPKVDCPKAATALSMNTAMAAAMPIDPPGIFRTEA
jgi:hypothetical protein